MSTDVPTHRRPGWVRRTRSFLFAVRWPLLGLGWLFALVMGFIGFQSYDLQVGGAPRDWSDSLYRAIVLFSIQGGDLPGDLPRTLNIARFLAPVIAASTALQALLVLFREEVEQALAGTCRG